MAAGRTLLLLAALAAPALAGCLGSPRDLVVVASAPDLANGMTIAVAVPRGILGGGDGKASYIVLHNGQPVYPPGGVVGAPLALSEGRGSAFVPYANFVVDNGDYVVQVQYEDLRASTQVPIEKWVNWVYALPYVRNGNLVVETVLERTPGMPNARIFAEGQLNLEIHYRGVDGKQDALRLSRTVLTDGTRDFLRHEIPLPTFMRNSRDEGYYSVEATFHNFHANGNAWVPMDPTLANANPPTNWVYVRS